LISKSAPESLYLWRLVKQESLNQAIAAEAQPKDVGLCINSGIVGLPNAGEVIRLAQ